MNAIPMLLILVIVLLYFPASDERTITAYSASCANGETIMPLSIALRRHGAENGFKIMGEAEANCAILTGGRTTYRINRARGEVAYKAVGYDAQPGKLVNCTILSRADWTCEYSDQSGKVAFIGGLPALYEADFERSGLEPLFYMRSWQWWAVRFLGMFGVHPIQSARLIPEQKLAW